MHVSKRMFADFEAYWRRLQSVMASAHPSVAGIPTRRQFNPMAVPKLLPNLYMIEHISDDELMIRLTGTALDDALDMSLTNKNMLDFYAGDERTFFRSVHSNMAKQPCGAVLRRFVTLTNGKGYDMTSKSLPLAAESGRIKYIVGMMGADLMRLSPLGEKAVIADTTITDFFYVDLGYGVPDEEHGWIQSQRAS